MPVFNGGNVVNKSMNAVLDDPQKDSEILMSPSNTTVWIHVADMNLESSDDVNTSSDLDMGEDENLDNQEVSNGIYPKSN